MPSSEVGQRTIWKPQIQHSSGAHATSLDMKAAMSGQASDFTRTSMPERRSSDFHKPTQVFDFTSDAPRHSGGIRVSDSGGKSQFESGFLPPIPTSPRKQGIRISDNGCNKGSMSSGFSMDPESRQKGIRISSNGTNTSHLEAGLTLGPEARSQGIRISPNGTNYGHFEHGFLPLEENRKSGGIRISGNGPNRSHFSGFVADNGPERRISGAGGSAHHSAVLHFGEGGLTHDVQEPLMKSKARTSLSGSMTGQLSSELLGPDSPPPKVSPHAGFVSKSSVFSGEEVQVRRLSHPSENGQNTFSSTIFKEVELKAPANRHAGAATVSQLSSCFDVIKEQPTKTLNSVQHAGKMTESHFSLYSPVK